MIDQIPQPEITTNSEDELLQEQPLQTQNKKVIIIIVVAISFVLIVALIFFFYLYQKGTKPISLESISTSPSPIMQAPTKNSVITEEKKKEVPTPNQETTQNTNNDNSIPFSWITYENKELGFTISYPFPDKVDTKEYLAEEIIIISGEASTEETNYKPWLHNLKISVHSMDNSTTLEQVIRNKYNIVGDYIEPQNTPFDTLSDVKFKIEMFEKINNPNFEGVRFFASVEPDQGTDEGLSINEAYIKYPNQQKYLLIENTLPTNYYPTPLFDKIISTFRFIPE